MYGTKDFSAPDAALPARRMRMHKELGRDRARTAVPKQPEGCPMPYSVMLSNIRPRKGGENGDMWRDGVGLPK